MYIFSYLKLFYKKENSNEIFYKKKIKENGENCSERKWKSWKDYK